MNVIDMTLYEGELMDIVEVTCPYCGYDRLELIINNYQCLRCQNVFNTGGK
jgi:transposase